MREMDNIFKNKLKNHALEVQDGTWDKIEHRLPRQKNGYRLMVWGIVSAAFLLLMGTLILHYYLEEYQTATIEVPSPDVSAIKPIAISNSQADDAENTSILISEHQNDNQVQTENTSSTKVLMSDLSNNSDVTVLNEKPSDSAFNNVAEISDSKLFQKISTTSAEIIDPFIVQYVPLTTDVEKTDIPKNLHTNEISIPQRVSALKYHENKDLLDNVMLRHVTRDKEACSFIWRGYQKSLDVYYSADFVDIKLDGPEEFNDYIDMREATEKTVYSHSMGVRLGYNVGYRWNLHTGIQYGQMTQRFQYTDPEAHEPRIEIIKQYIYSNGQLVDSTFTEKVEYLPGSKNHKIYNKYSTWDIPMLARYTIAAHNKWSVSAMGGVFLNVAFQQSGIILDSDNTTPIFLAQERDGAQIFKAGLGISFYSALSMAYYLTPAWDLIVEPHMRIAPSSMTTSDYPLTQRFNVYGLGVGLRYRF